MSYLSVKLVLYAHFRAGKLPRESGKSMVKLLFLLVAVAIVGLVLVSLAGQAEQLSRLHHRIETLEGPIGRSQRSVLSHLGEPDTVMDISRNMFYLRWDVTDGTIGYIYLLKFRRGYCIDSSKESLITTISIDLF
jgi:hypothetical protein